MARIIISTAVILGAAAISAWLSLLYGRTEVVLWLAVTAMTLGALKPLLYDRARE